MKSYKRKCQPLTEVGEPMDWNKLFDGGIYQCDEGVDYIAPTTTFVTILMHKAASRKLTIRLSIKDDKSGFVVQAVL